MSTQDRPNLYDRPIFAGNSPRSGKAPSAPILPRRRMSLNLKLFLFLVVVLAALVAIAFLALRPEEDVYTLDTFQYTAVGMRDFRNVVQTSGRFVPSDVVVLTAPGEATALSTQHAAGDDVEAGSLLAVLDSEGLRSDLAAAPPARDLPDRGGSGPAERATGSRPKPKTT